MLQVLVVGGNEGGIPPCCVIGGGQFLQRADQGLGHETPAVAAEMAGGIGIGVEIGGGGAVHEVPVYGRTKVAGMLHFNALHFPKIAIKSDPFVR